MTSEDIKHQLISGRTSWSEGRPVVVTTSGHSTVKSSPPETKQLCRKSVEVAGWAPVRPRPTVSVPDDVKQHSINAERPKPGGPAEMSWCLLSSDVSCHIRGKLWPISAEARFNKSLRPRKPEGSLGRTAQDVHLDSHTAPELWQGRRSECGASFCRDWLTGRPDRQWLKDWPVAAETEIAASQA